MTTIVVLGGGYGGIAAARELDRDFDVTLVEPRDRFVHNVAALRGLVDHMWAERMFLPYDNLLSRGAVLRDRAAAVDAVAGGVLVELASGYRLYADYAVLATGSAYPFPAKIDDDSAHARARLTQARDALAASSAVVLLGAGPAGLELAGEIRAAWPRTDVTVVDRAPDILPGPLPDALRRELRDQLETLGIELVLGTALVDDPPTAPGEHASFETRTVDGRRVAADIWYRCYGVSPRTSYLRGALASTRLRDGSLDVHPDLRLRGQERIFAIGDVTAVREAKMAKAAEQHASVVATNVRALAAGSTNLTAYAPAPPGISLPLGPSAGASYSLATGVLGAQQTAQLKGRDLRIDVYRATLGLR